MTALIRLEEINLFQPPYLWKLGWGVYSKVHKMEQIPWKYLFYHSYEDVMHTKNVDRLFSHRLQFFDSLHENVFESKKVYTKEYLDL